MIGVAAFMRCSCGQGQAHAGAPVTPLQSQFLGCSQDFGLSQRLDPHATHVSGFGAGTPFYVAPEVRSRVHAWAHASARAR